MQQLRTQQMAAGGVLSPTQSEIPASFGNQAAVKAAIDQGVAVYDRTHWGRIQVAGADRVRFLHNQTTNDFNSLKPGQGCDTVFVTSTARTIDLVTAYVLDDSILLLTSPGYNQRLIDWMDRFIFFADKVELKDLTDSTAVFSLVGAASDALIKTLSAGDLIGQPQGTHLSLSIGGAEVRVAVGSGLTTPGYTLWTSIDQAATLWQTLLSAEAVPMGEEDWQALRIQQGRPIPGQELTDDYNPLEVGLWHTISLSKGCYIGQETIARLHTYRGVKQQLWGIRLSQPAELNAVVMAGSEKIGRLTSCTALPAGYVGLAYIRTKNVEPNLKVTIANHTESAEATPIEGELIPLSFVSHEYL